jgi:hypothetical protein
MLLLLRGWLRTRRPAHALTRVSAAAGKKNGSRAGHPTWLGDGLRGVVPTVNEIPKVVCFVDLFDFLNAIGMSIISDARR